MDFSILRGIERRAPENRTTRTLTGFRSVTYKPASVGERTGQHRAGGVLAPCYLTLLFCEKGFAGGGLLGVYPEFLLFRGSLRSGCCGRLLCGEICAVRVCGDWIWRDALCAEANCQLIAALEEGGRLT